MRRLAVMTATFFLLIGGVSLALVCAGGASGNGNAGHDQYNPKPGCGPWKSDGYAGGSGYHDGQPPKDDNRGDCPDPPCDDHYGHFSGYGSSQQGNDDCNDDCDSHKYSGYGSGGGGNDDNCCDSNHKYSGYGSGGGGGGKDDCRSSSADVSPVELSRT